MESSLDTYIDSVVEKVEANFGLLDAFWLQFQSGVNYQDQRFVSNFQSLGFDCLQRLIDGRSRIFSEKVQLWRFQQQRAANGLRLNFPQVIKEEITKLLQPLSNKTWELYNRLQSFSGNFQNIPFPVSQALQSLLDSVRNLLVKLTNDAFVVEHQPCQLMKTTEKPKEVPKINMLINTPFVTKETIVFCSMIDEETAREIVEKGNLPTQGKCQLANNQGTFELQPQCGYFSAEFEKLKLVTIGKRPKEVGSRVVEKKQTILFWAEAKVGTDTFGHIYTLSLPISIQSNVSQDWLAEAVIMWDNAFGVKDRLPFDVPQEVDWIRLIRSISAKFESMGKGLEQSDAKFLKAKAGIGETIAYETFCKGKLPGNANNCSLWQFIFEFLKLLRKNVDLNKMWRDGLIKGFIEREEAEKLLWNCETGTFLLRFSDSVLGGISISAKVKPYKVVSTEPMTDASLGVNPLPLLLLELTNLKMFYNIFGSREKHEALATFGKKYIDNLQETNSSSGYKKIKKVIDCDSDEEMQPVQQ